jgi:hypothetical protein
MCRERVDWSSRKQDRQTKQEHCAICNGRIRYTSTGLPTHRSEIATSLCFTKGLFLSKPPHLALFLISQILLQNSFIDYTAKFWETFITIQINQPTRCKSFTSLLFDVYVWLNMFRAPFRPSSGAYNCTRRLSLITSQTTTNNAPTATLQR